MDNLTIFDCLYPTYKITNPIRLIELFAGIGSQAKALKNLKVNFEHYKIVDIDKYAITSYNAIHNTNFKPLDITKIHANDLEIVDIDKYEYIMTYSFPCQDLSLAGKGKGMAKDSGTRSSLLWEVERILKECEELPQILLMENVPEVIGEKNIQYFQEWQLFLEKIGYSNYIDLLNAKNYGIPQNRNRCFMISILGDYNYTFPKPKKLNKKALDFIDFPIDEKYILSKKYLEKITFQEKGNEIANLNYTTFEQSNVVHNINKLCPTIRACMKDNDYLNTINFAIPLETTVCINSKINGKQPKVQDRIYDSNGLMTAITTSFLPSLGIKIFEATKKGYTLSLHGDGIYIDRPHQKREVVQKDMIQTIKTSGKDIGIVNWNGNNYIVKKITPKECWRFMGFSDEDFEKASKVNNNTQLYKQAGNSIVVNVLEAIFKELII